MFERNPEASFDELQNSLHHAAQQSHSPGLGLISHAAILIKASNRTVIAVDELRAEIRRLDSKNGKLQNWVIGLAIASLLATCVQTYVALSPSSASLTLHGAQKPIAVQSASPSTVPITAAPSKIANEKNQPAASASKSRDH